MPLRPLVEPDLPMVRAWRNHPDVRRWMFTQHEIGEAEHRAWFEGLRGDSTRLWCVYEDDEGGPAGVVYVTQIDAARGSGFWGFYAAPGAPAGTGTRMQFEALEKVFGDLGLYKLNCEVLALNELALHLYAKFGFVEEGRFREHFFDGQQRQDVVRLGLLTPEWAARRPRMLERIAQLVQLRRASRGGGGIVRLLILCDDGSWIRPYLHDAMVEWAEQGYQVALRARPEEDESADVCFCLSYSRILRPEQRAQYRHMLVVHESALPEGRGWSPMTWKILEGRTHIPVTLFEAVDAVDAGRIHLQGSIQLYGSELHNDWRHLQAEATLELCNEWLRRYPDVLDAAREQTGTATYYRRRTSADSRLDPALSLEAQFDLLRTVDNVRYPAWFQLRGERYRLAVERITEPGAAS